MEKTQLEKIYGEVFSTGEAIQKYEFITFCAPIVKVRRRFDGTIGTLEFQHSPRFYFKFVEHNPVS